MKKNDFILIGIIVAVAAVLLVVLYGFNNKSGSLVTIEVDSQIVETLPLDENTERDIVTDNGTNHLVISDGKATMTSADCPDEICVHHKPISRSGESIICLPHKVVVTVVNEKPQDDEIDAVA